jgi:hypothetical protein
MVLQQALGEGKCEDGDFIPVCNGSAKGRSHGFIRHKEWLPSFQAGTAHARLVLLPIRWPALPMHSPAIRLGAVSSVVHAVARSSGPTSSHGTGVQSIGLYRRLSRDAKRSRNSGQIARLPQGNNSDRQVAEKAWLDKTSHKRRVDWHNADRAPRSGGGHNIDEVLYCSKDDREDKEP